MAKIIAVDFGTSNVKAAAVDEMGQVQYVAREQIDLRHPHQGWAEQDPDEWVVAAERAVRQVVEDASLQPGDVAAIGLCGQMHTLVLLDEKGCPLRAAINWADRRAVSQVEFLASRWDSRLASRLGNPPVAGFTAPSLLWIRENEPEVLERADKICLPKDYARFRWTGSLCTDVSDASGTLLFNVRERSWDWELVDELGINPALLPPVRESPEIAGKLAPKAARRLGLAEGTPVVAGAGDTIAAALGSGLVDEGRTMITIGTGGQVYAVSSKPHIDEPELRVHTLCHCLPGKWGIMGATLTAGLALKWFNSLFGDQSLARVVAEADPVSPGAGGLMFLPLLAGERTPHMDPKARGAFVGLTLEHGRAHMARAVLEGVCFSLKAALDVVDAVAGRSRQLVLGGGGIQSPTWQEILIDVLGREAFVPVHHERALTGAALLAALAVGIEKSAEDVGVRLSRAGEVHEPQVEQMKKYERLYQRYRQLYPGLTGLFAEMADYA